MNVFLTLLGLCFPKLLLAAEWTTVSGGFCLIECTGENSPFHWCYVTDASKTFFPDESEENDHLNVKFKWDYCVPSQQEMSSYETSTSKPEYNRPFWSSKTALNPITNCTSECKRSRGNTKSDCNTVTDNPYVEETDGYKWFYCVGEEKKLQRSQLSSIHKLWCIDQCRSENQNHYWCTTLYGKDHCSPSPGKGSQNGNCLSPCTLHENDYYFCYTSSDNSTWEYCGNHEVSNEKKNKLEFTYKDAVCADPCHIEENSQFEVCNFVFWDYNATTGRSTLLMDKDYCRGYTENFGGLNTTSWIIIIVIVVVLLILALIIIIVLSLKHRGYQATRTNES